MTELSLWSWAKKESKYGTENKDIDELGLGTEKRRLTIDWGLSRKDLSSLRMKQVHFQKGSGKTPRAKIKMPIQQMPVKTD